jgi:hypothetical protein
MAKNTQKPVCCDKCGDVLMQIEPDESVPSKCLHWGQKQNYWSVELHSWEKIGSRKHHEAENYELCDKCKKAVCKFIRGLINV